MSKKENTWELTKFLITGLVCAAADFLTTSFSDRFITWFYRRCVFKLHFINILGVQR